MRTIEAVIVVDESKQLTIQLPDDISPGQHKVIVVINEQVDASGFMSSQDIDDAFADMKDDLDYQREAVQVENEFATAQWEAIQVAEADA